MSHIRIKDAYDEVLQVKNCLVLRGHNLRNKFEIPDLNYGWK